MRDQVISMLTALGVTGAATDPLLDILLQNVQQRILNKTNQSVIPEGLESVAVYMAVGEYLNMKKTVEGSLTPEQRLNGLIDYLINGRSDELYRYRKLVW